MLNELYIAKLIKLIEGGLITIESIKDVNYKLEVEKRLNPQPEITE
jgi:hypothetical protein